MLHGVIGLQASTKDVGPEECYDYIFIKGKVRVDTTQPDRGARLIGDQPVVRPFCFCFVL